MHFASNLKAGNETDILDKPCVPGQNDVCDTFGDTIYMYLYIHICEGDTFYFYGAPITIPGIYETTIGMDSIVILVLSFYNSPVIFGNIEICEGDSIDIFGEIYSQEGQYILEIIDKNGCTVEGSITIQWFVVDTTVVRQGNRLVALATASTFQWYDCITDLPIPEANHRTFIPSANGSFKVEVTDINECTAYSGCFDAIIVSTLESKAYHWQILPNPVSDILEVIIDQHTYKDIYIEIIDMLGRLQIKQTFSPENTDKQIDVKALPLGIFILKLSDANGHSSTKFFSKIYP